MQGPGSHTTQGPGSHTTQGPGSHKAYPMWLMMLIMTMVQMHSSGARLPGACTHKEACQRPSFPPPLRGGGFIESWVLWDYCRVQVQHTAERRHLLPVTFSPADVGAILQIRVMARTYLASRFGNVSDVVTQDASHQPGRLVAGDT
eukprot:336278-Chlamydomonas_euryale.AAC.4